MIDGYIIHIQLEEIQDNGGKGTIVYSLVHAENTEEKAIATLQEVIAPILFVEYDKLRAEVQEYPSSNS